MLKSLTKITAVATLFLLFSTTAFAQFPNHVKGDITIKGSVGLPFTDGKKVEAADGQTVEKSLMAMFMQGSIDYAISNHLDIGVFGGMGNDETKLKSGDQLVASVKGTYMGGGARIVYHIWGKARTQWDPYVLVGAGMLSESLEVSGGDNDMFGAAETRVIYTARVGMNYYFTPTFGVHAEGGYGISYGTLGMNLRF